MLLVYLVALVLLSVSVSAVVVPLVPLPSSLSLGSSSLSLSPSFHFKQVKNDNSIISSIIIKANDRYVKLYKNKYTINSSSSSSSTGSSISVCLIKVDNVDDNINTLGYDVNEEYSISIDNTGDCVISSSSVWGALYAMETFTQLLERSNNDIICNYIPLSISDNPRWKHRGMLIDTSRHYLSINMIENIIDLLSMHKYNVLHWHIVDSQSFPFQSESSPDLVKGAYANTMIYTMNDVKMITQYAGERGVRMLIEIDVPGHSYSWGKGYPDITANCPNHEANVNNVALNPSLDKTYDILNGVLKDVIKVTNQKYLHLGGDEVVYSCWKEDPSITSFMTDNNIQSYDDMLGYFVAKADNFVIELGATPIHWEEIYTANVKVPSNTIFEVWTNSTKMADVTSSGYTVIAAPSDKWYLNTQGNPPQSTTSWESMYTYDPSVGLSTEQASHIIGGEAALWGEYADDANWIQIAFPRSSAVSERLWSHSTVNNVTEFTNRLQIQVCRLKQRGYAVSPIQPSYCSNNYI